MAVISRVSASLPFLGERQALLDAKAVLLVDDHEGEVAKRDVRLQQRVGPDDDRGQARGEAGQGRVARPALFPPGQQADLDPSGAGQPAQGRLMLAGEDLGRRHQCRLCAALDRGQHRHQRDHGLAAADIALQQPHHAVGVRHIAADLGDRHPLRAGQVEPERCLDLRSEHARPDDRAAAAALAASADQCHRELAREHLVIGKALARRLGRRQIGLGRGGMGMAQGLGPGGPAAPLPERRVDPFRQLGSSVERCCRGALHDARKQA